MADNAGMEKSPPDGVIRFDVEKISTLDYEGRDSPEIEVKGVPWKGQVYKKVDSDGFHLASVLFCSVDQSKRWGIDVDAEHTLVHSDSTNNITVEMSALLNGDSLNSNCAGEVLLDWKTFIDNEKGFINNDTITVEIRFWVNKVNRIRIANQFDFTDSMEPYHDVALVIGGQKVYVSKQYLAIHSPVFNAMFYGEFAEKDKKEIELQDVDREEFIELLHVIYPLNKKITDGSAEFLLRLGDRFQIKCLIEGVEDFYHDHSKVSHVEKLRIAEKFKLLELQEHCLSELTTTQEFIDIKDSHIYNDLSKDLKVTLFERLLSVAK